MQGIDIKNIEISDFQKFLREVNAAIWTEKGKIMYYEEKLTDLKELPINEENKKLISKYIMNIFKCLIKIKHHLKKMMLNCLPELPDVPL